MKKILFSFLTLLIVLVSFGFDASPDEEKHKFTFKVNGQKEGDPLLIAYYFGGKQYIRDTVFFNAKGVAVYEGDETIPGGIYLAVLPTKNYFEFIINDQEFTMETQSDDLVGKMKIKGSEENSQFYEYLNKIAVQQKLAEPIQKGMKEKEEIGDKEGVKELQKELREIEIAVNEIKDGFIEDYPENFASKVFKASKDPVVPPAPILENGEKDSTFEFRYFKAHYFDHIDFSDARMLYTPILTQKIRYYLEKLTVQDPDSVIKSVKTIMNLAEQDKEVMKYCTIFISNKYGKDKRMCFDKVYVYMGENYYLKDKAYWIDSTQLAKITDRVYKMKYNQCGNRAVNLKVQNYDGNPTALGDVRAKFTVLYFWDYDCGHCKKVTPIMKKFYEEYKKYDVEVFAICTRDDIERFKKYVDENELNWINTIDPEHKSYFRVYYDIYSTPVIYLLDQDKRIIGKRIDVPSLKKFISYELDIPYEEDPADVVPGVGDH